MAFAVMSDDDAVWAVLQRWGHGLRRARFSIAMSQDRLEVLSGVDQSAISRFERCLAPRMPAERLARLGLVLGYRFPLGGCPHEHGCPWNGAAPGGPTSPPMTLERFYDWRQHANE